MGQNINKVSELNYKYWGEIPEEFYKDEDPDLLTTLEVSESLGFDLSKRYKVNRSNVALSVPR